MGTDREQSDGFFTLSSTALWKREGGAPPPCAVEDDEMAIAGEGEGFPILGLADNRFSATSHNFQHTSRQYHRPNYLKVSKIRANPQTRNLQTGSSRVAAFNPRLTGVFP